MVSERDLILFILSSLPVLTFLLLFEPNSHIVSSSAKIFIFKVQKLCHHEEGEGFLLFFTPNHSMTNFDTTEEKPFENIVGRGKNADTYHFLFFH